MERSRRYHCETGGAGEQKKQQEKPSGKPLFLVIGESAAGKDTVVNLLCTRYGYTKVVSSTTRPRRSSETGQEHTFLTPAEFDAVRDKLAAYTVFDGYEYGVTEPEIGNRTFYTVDYRGLCYLKGHYNQRPLKVIYLTAPEEIRRSRMLGRGQTPGEVQRRLLFDREAFPQEKMIAEADLVLEDLDLEQTVSRVKKFVDDEN